MIALRASLPVVVVVVVALAPACPGTGDGPVVDPDGQIQQCTASEQCPEGHICSGGGCTLGTCDPLLELACDTQGLESPYCCKAWELCSTLSFTCANDPNVRGVGCPQDEPACTPCENDNDCPNAGQFCTGGRCLDAAGRETCTSSFQCPGGERCDRTVFLCVPNEGGCPFCGSFPELCCEEDQVCSEQTGFCQDIPEAECSVDTDCNPGLFCDDLFRCVQCDSDDDCGFGLLCDEGEGDCFSRQLSCSTDDDCIGNYRCALALQTCVIPECTDDNDCSVNDDRFICKTDEFRCVLPPAVCTESDEPNETLSTAVPLGDDFSYGGILCRGDTDVLSFDVVPNRRYTATVDFGGSGQPGIIVAMLGTNGAVESSATFSSTQAVIEVAGVTGENESGRFYVRLIGANEDSDQWQYTVSIRDDEPSQPADCSESGQAEEPNDSFNTATLLNEGTFAYARCGTDDVDFYRIPVPPLFGVRVVVSGFFNAEGNLNLELFKAPNNNAGSRVDTGQTTNDVEIVDGAEGTAEFYLRVFLSSAAGAVADQRYSVTVTHTPRSGFCQELADCPAALAADACTDGVCTRAGAPVGDCVPDATEDDGTLERAAVLTLVNDANGNAGITVPNIVRCNPQDVDHFRFTVPASRSGAVLLRFNHNEGDIALDLLDAATGVQVATSNVSNAGSDPDEQVTIPGSADSSIDYVARVRLASTTATNITGQRYSLEITTFDNSQCLASEPAGGDDEFANGRCVGEFTPTAGFPCINEGARLPEPLNPTGDIAVCEVAPENEPGCGRICNNDDDDWYRVGTLVNDQVLKATLSYRPSDGALALVRGTLNTNGSVTESTTNDSDNDGRIELVFEAPRNQPREYAIRVRPQGTVGHQLERYALRIEVGLPCIDDQNDAGAASNENPAEATLIRPNPQIGAAFHFNSTTAFSPASSKCKNDVDVYELFSFIGETVTVELDQLDTSPTGMIVELGTRPPDLGDPPLLVPNGSGIAGGPPVEFTNTANQQLYVVVRTPSGTTSNGPYTLLVSTTP